MASSAHYRRVLCHMIPSADDLLICDDPDGLSRVAIWTLAQDQRGCLWIGTDEGPVRFDGIGWGVPSGLDGLGANLIWGIDATEQDALWLATDGMGLWQVDHGATPCRTRRVLTAEQGLPDDDIHYLCRDHNGALWVGTHHGLAVVEGGQVRSIFTTRTGIPEAGICSLCTDPQGRVWAGSLHGLLLFEQGALHAHLTMQQGLPDDRVYAIASDQQGRIWVGTREGVCVLVDGVPSLYIRDTLPAAEVRTLCPDRDGHMWVGTARGLALLEDLEVARCWTHAEGLPSSSIWSLLRDRDNRIWVGTESGLALMRQPASPVRRCRSYTQDAGSAYSLAADCDHRIWLGTSSGLVKSDARTFSLSPILGQPAVLAQAAAWCVLIDADGWLWTGGRYGGLFCLDPQTGKTLTHIEGIDAPLCLCDDGEGSLWVGTHGSGIFQVDRLQGRIVHRLTIVQGLPADQVSALCLDRHGTLWVGTLGGGLGCIERAPGAPPRAQVPIDGLPNPFISALTIGQDGHVWGATQGGGLFRVDPSRRRIRGVWTVADGLPTNMILSCAFDAQGALWAGTTRGLVRFQPATGTCITLGRPHGIPSENCQRGALLVDQQTRLWVGTPEGVAVVLTEAIPSTIPPCTVLLTGFWTMGQEQDMAAPIVLDDAQYDLEIAYTAIEFTAPAQVMYRTWLDGLAQDWSAPHPHRFARYTNLRPSDYRFRVCARNWGGEWSEPAELRFTVVRNRRAQEMEEALEREQIEAAVQRATAQRLEELNRSLVTTQFVQTALVSQLRLQQHALQQQADQDGLTGILNRRALEAFYASAVANTSRNLRPLTIALMDIDNFKQVNDSFSHTTGDTVLRTAVSLWQRHLRAGDVLGRFGGDELMVIFPDTSEDEAFQACERCREAVAAYPWETIDPNLRITMSIGVQAYQAGDDLHILLDRTDHQLYRAKAQGRNQTCMATAY